MLCSLKLPSRNADCSLDSLSFFLTLAPPLSSSSEPSSSTPCVTGTSICMDGGDKDLALDALPSTGTAAFTSNPREFALAVQKNDSSAYKEFYRQKLRAHSNIWMDLLGWEPIKFNSLFCRILFNLPVCAEAWRKGLALTGSSGHASSLSSPSAVSMLVLWFSWPALSVAVTRSPSARSSWSSPWHVAGAGMVLAFTGVGRSPRLSSSSMSRKGRGLGVMRQRGNK